MILPNPEKEKTELPLAALKEPYQNMALVYYDENHITEEKISDCVKEN